MNAFEPLDDCVLAVRCHDTRAAAEAAESLRSAYPDADVHADGHFMAISRPGATVNELWDILRENVLGPMSRIGLTEDSADAIGSRTVNAQSSDQLQAISVVGRRPTARP